jgi:hypothetical protein
MPAYPGGPGLIFASRHDTLESMPWSLFTKRIRAKSAVWEYLGEYRYALCGKMDAGQFASQQKAVITFIISWRTFFAYGALGEKSMVKPDS